MALVALSLKGRNRTSHSVVSHLVLTHLDVPDEEPDGNVEVAQAVPYLLAAVD